MRESCVVAVDIGDGRRRQEAQGSKITEDVDDSVEEAELPALQVEVVNLIAESDNDYGAVQRKADWEARAAREATAMKTDAKVKGEGGELKRAGLARDEVFERELMLLALEGMQLARGSFHQFDEFKCAARELYERERLEPWSVDVGRIELCNDETLLEYLVAFVWTLVGQAAGGMGCCR
ncbi:hypothetical protein DYB28_000393 [Aphanomyces astaci]|uniref:Uncharacterized protein n=1 Tax=Aphanomyces astaci TaxID=112090 RepID=A0A9X8DNG1_APHAT|nr:hypothetical protein DYB28_000393 [Aphanomyces astaci]